MPFQPINFAGIPVQRTEYPDLARKFMEAFQLGQVPAAMKRKAEEEELGNQFKRLQIDQLENPKVDELGNSLKEQQIQKLRLENDPELKAKYAKQLMQTLNEGGLGNTGDLGNALYRKLLGLPEETAAEKRKADKQADLDLFREKEKTKGETENLTTRARTVNQGIIQSIDNTLPLIQELKVFKEPNQLIGKHLNPNAQAQYEAQSATITDSLVGALNLPKTNESIHLVNKIVQRRPLESHDAYVKRLGELEKDLNRRRDKASDALKKFNPSEQKREEKSGITRVFYNGKPYMVPNDKLEEALSAGGSLNG